MRNILKKSKKITRCRFLLLTDLKLRTQIEQFSCSREITFTGKKKKKFFSFGDVAKWNVFRLLGIDCERVFQIENFSLFCIDILVSIVIDFLRFNSFSFFSNLHTYLGIDCERFLEVQFFFVFVQISWYRLQKKLHENDRQLFQSKPSSLRLSIRNVKNEDFGNYSCKAENNLGKARAYISISGFYLTAFNIFLIQMSPTMFVASKEL